jgi:serine/threonine protein phosphatase PrpC
VKQGDTLILHSDDVPGLVTEEEMIDVVKRRKGKSARQLAQMISDSLGNQINVTVTVVRFSGEQSVSRKA